MDYGAVLVWYPIVILTVGYLFLRAQDRAL